MDKVYTGYNQAVIETHYDGWSVVHQQANNHVTEVKDYPRRIQSTIDPNCFVGMENWVRDKMNEHNIPVKKVTVDESWLHNYKPHEYQSVHNHTGKPNLISLVMYAQDLELDLPNDNSGSLYTIIAERDLTLSIDEVVPTPGKTVLMTGNVNHGTYPYHNVRSALVINFVTEWLEPEEEIK